MEKLVVFGTMPFYTNVAMGQTISAIELHERVLSQLVNGIAVFSFLKADGETVRNAIGTCNKALIPAKDGTTRLDFAEQGLFYAYKAFVDKDAEALETFTEHLPEIKKFIDKTENPVIPKERKLSPDTQSFYDIEAQAWKSYKIDNLLTMIVPGAGEQV